MKELNETILSLLGEYVEDGRFYLTTQSFRYIKEDIVELLEETIPEEEFDYEEIDSVVELIFSTHIKNILYYGSLEKPPSVKKDEQTIKETIHHIRNIPQPEQRTDEWYIFRQKLITASSAWKIFSSEKIKNSFIYDKCKPLDITKYKQVNMHSPFHWGIKYEPLSIMIYEDLYDTKVEDFGCIKHDKYDYLGASPDGINIKQSSDKYGTMLEIKNVVSREITEIPKFDYWIQMQLQMEVCNLDECDFLETKFIEYEDYKTFLMDGSFSKSNDQKTKGVIMCFMVDNHPVYEYSPLHLEEEAYKEWEQTMMDTYKEAFWLKNIYWKLDIFSCILIKRNKSWFMRALPFIENVYKTIEYEKKNGYEHRAAKKQAKKPIIYIPPFSGCVINV